MIPTHLDRTLARNSFMLDTLAENVATGKRLPTKHGRKVRCANRLRSLSNGRRHHKMYSLFNVACLVDGGDSHVNRWTSRQVGEVFSDVYSYAAVLHSAE